MDVVSPVIRIFRLFAVAGKALYKNHTEFKSAIDDVIKWLDFLEPWIQEFEGYDYKEYRELVQKLESTLENGRILIENCTEVSVLAVKTKHDLTKKVRVVIKDIKRQLILLDTYRNHIMKKIDDEASEIIRINAVLPNSASRTVGLEKPLEELKMKLLTSGKSVVVLTGPGGFGKTTLARELCDHEDVTGKFGSNIFFIRIPNFFNMKGIDPDEQRQREDIMISENILQKQNQNQFSRPAGSSVYGGLREFLRNAGENHLLLVFDHITPKTFNIIDRFFDGTGGIKMLDYKILVTSRSKLPRFDSYYMKSLKTEDAIKLFNHFLIETGPSNDGKLQVVALCKGVPQAIEEVATSFRGKTLHEWKTLQDKLQHGSVLDFGNDLLKRLQSSVDALESLDEMQSTIIKKCFMDLCVFLKDQPIPAAALIDIWSELYKFPNEADASIANLYLLTKSCFANILFPRMEEAMEEVEEDDSYYCQHFVTQHDILRDLAIRQGNSRRGSGDRLVIDVQGNAEVTYRRHDARIVSISTVREVPKELDKLKLPNAEVLVLHFQAETYALPNFLNTMSKTLKVLIVTNHGRQHAKVSDFGLLSSLSTLKRLRLEGILVSSMKTNMLSMKFSIEVKSLLKITLFMCDFDQAYGKSSIKLSKLFPNLVEINIDYGDNLKELPAELCGLKKLKKLNITNCDKLIALPEVIGKLVQLEVLRLIACTKLLKLPLSISKLKELQVLNVSACWSIQEWPNISEMFVLRKLIVKHCPGLRQLPHSISECLGLRQLPDSISDRLPAEKKKMVTLLVCDEETRNLWGDAGINDNIKVIKSN